MQLIEKQILHLLCDLQIDGIKAFSKLEFVAYITPKDGQSRFARLLKQSLCSRKNGCGQSGESTNLNRWLKKMSI